MTPNANPTAKPRSLFATKTAFAQYVTAAAGMAAVFYPPVTTWVSENAGYILLAIPVINLAVRKFTHGSVVLIAE